MKRTVTVYFCFLVASAAVFLLPTTRGQIDLLGNSAQLTGLLFAGFSFWLAGQHAQHLKVQKACSWIAFGMWIWGVGQLMVTYSELLLHQSPYGTVSSCFFVTGNVIIVAAVFSIVRHFFKTVIRKEDFWGYILPAVIVACVLALVVIVMDWRLLTDPNRNGIWKILDLLYPFFDIMIVVLTIILTRVAKSSGDSNSIKAYAFLCSAFGILLLGDMIAMDATFEATLYRAVDVIYFSSYFLAAISGNFLARGPAHH